LWILLDTEERLYLLWLFNAVSCDTDIIFSITFFNWLLSTFVAMLKKTNTEEYSEFLLYRSEQYTIRWSDLFWKRTTKSKEFIPSPNEVMFSLFNGFYSCSKILSICFSHFLMHICFSHLFLFCFVSFLIWQDNKAEIKIK